MDLSNAARIYAVTAMSNAGSVIAAAAARYVVVGVRSCRGNS